jgi:hypothetical protein
MVYDKNQFFWVGSLIYSHIMKLLLFYHPLLECIELSFLFFELLNFFA